MKLGFCTGKDGLDLALRAGCDYVEMSFTSVARMSEAEYEDLCRAVEATPLAVEAMNGFIPGDYPLCTMEDDTSVMDYIRSGMERAKRLGVKAVVFGSGAARHIPEGMEKTEALERITAFLVKAGEIARGAGVTIAVEPLCYAEDNAVNTLMEGWQLAKDGGVRLLADLYHMGQNGENMADIVKTGDDLVHCHIGRPGSRKYPMPGDGYDYAPFFRALRENDYEGRVSIEAGYPSSPEDLVTSIAYLRDFLK